MKKTLFAFPAHLFMVLCGVLGSLFCLTTGFEIPVDEKLLFLGAAAFSLGFTALFSVKKLLWKGLLLLAAGGGLAFWAFHSWDKIVLGGERVLDQIQSMYAGVWLGLSGPLAGVVRTEAVREGNTLFLLALGVLLGCYLAWGTVSLRTFWPGAAVTAVFLVPVLGIELLPHVLPLTALLLYYCVGLLSRIAGKTDAQGGAKLTYLAAPLTAALLVALYAALPEEGFQRSEWAEERRIALTEMGFRVGETLMSGELENLPQAVTGEDGTTVDLSTAGPLHYTGRTVLKVTAGASGRVYLRGMSSGRYDGKSWRPLEDRTYEQYLTGLDGTAADWTGIGGLNPLNFPAAAHYQTAAHVFGAMTEVEQVGGGKFLYVPYHLVSGPGEMTGATFHRDEYLERAAGYRNYSYLIYSQADPRWAGALVPQDMADVEESYRALVYDAYTALPEGYDADPLVEDFLEWLAATDEGWVTWVYTIDDHTYMPVMQIYGDTTEGRAIFAEQVARYLALHCEYDPNTPVTPAGEDFVEYFLTTSRRGYCMHFASAATVLLRAMGIPARYTSGYVADAEAGKTVLVADYAAHAWVEVYFDGYGWQPFEVTAGFDGALPWEQEVAEATPSPSPTPTLPPPPRNTPSPVKTPAPVSTPAPTQPQPGGEENGRADLRWLWVPAGLAALVGAELLRRRWAAWRRKARFLTAGTNRAVVNAYGDLERILSWTGERVEPPLLALAEKAKFSQHTLTEEERSGFLAAVAAAAARVKDKLPWYKRPFFLLVHGGWLGA